MDKDIQSAKETYVKNEMNDNLWKDVSSSIGRPELKYADPVANESVSEEFRGLSEVMAKFARASLAYIVAEGAMIEAGIDPMAMDAGARQQALSAEELAIDMMKHLVRTTPSGQLDTALAGANEQLSGFGVKFGKNQFGGIALVENGKQIWTLGKPPRETSDALKFVGHAVNFVPAPQVYN